MRSNSLLAAMLGVVLVLACEPETDSPCDPEQVKGVARVKVQSGTNVVVRDGALERDSWSAAPLCASTDGCRPSCMKPCEGDVQCAEAGERVSCQASVVFGDLACVSTPSGGGDADSIGDGYSCNGVTPDGEPTVLGNKCCAAAATTINSRDAGSGRAKFVVL